MSDGGDDGGGGDRDFTEVEYEGWGSRMKNSCGGVICGVILLFGSIGLLFWNEGRSVKRQKDLDEGRGILLQIGQSLPEDAIDTAKNGKLVYVFGDLEASNSTNLYDNLFDIDASTVGALKYERISEMYQWQESSSTKEEKVGSSIRRSKF